MARARARKRDMRPVRIWLWAVALLVILTLLVGGATRLTGSGLSITEWRPISGVLPPLSESAWLDEFEKYKRIPQFLAVNAGMDLAEFKFIYWWEWGHRLLGRLIGVVFAVPLLVFWWRGMIEGALRWKLAGLFLLGGLQGAIGWWMVSSGLSERTDVSQYRLAIHLTLACIILAAIVAVADSLLAEPKEKNASVARFGAAILLALVFLQIFTGALVAKTGAGMTFNTWPLIDGRFFPPSSDLFAIKPAWHNFFENVLTVQFEHRMVAYLLFIAAALHVFTLLRSGPLLAARRAAILFALITAQAMLGIVTLVYEMPFALAHAHQAGGVIVLIFATIHAARVFSYAARP
jgi:cytochrome c oxidase assembly protein subunit 15